VLGEFGSNTLSVRPASVGQGDPAATARQWPAPAAIEERGQRRRPSRIAAGRGEESARSVVGDESAAVGKVSYCGHRPLRGPASGWGLRPARCAARSS